VDPMDPMGKVQEWYSTISKEPYKLEEGQVGRPEQKRESEAQDTFGAGGSSGKMVMKLGGRGLV